MVYYKEREPRKIEKTEGVHMEYRQETGLLRELRDRMSDMLAAIELLTPLVREKGEPEDRVYLAALNKSLYRILRIIHHMGICSEEPLFQPEPLDVAGLCRDLGRQCEAMGRALQVNFHCSLTKESVLTVADDHLLEMALLNMLTNAFEAAGPGGEVTLRGSLSDGRWIVTVEDNGPGLRVPEEGEDPLLKRPGGLGLGLEVARKALSLHSGVLMLDNGEPGGVRAVMSLPVRKPTKEELLRSPAPRADLRGGFSSVLVEFSPLLPMESYFAEELE